MNRNILILILIVLAAWIAGCSTPAPSLQQGPDADVTFDGLVRIEHSLYRDAWADPDADWGRDTKIMPGGAFFEFRAVKKTSSTTAGRLSSTSNEYWIDDASKQKLQDEVSAIFNEELAKSTRFSVAEAPGSDVLIIRGGLLDIVSHTPPDLMGRGEIYLRSVGEASLVFEAVDSMSGEVLARATERQSIERPGQQAIMSNTVTTWAEVRRVARSWATKLRSGLDRLPEA
jgi:hypothetical protein